MPVYYISAVSIGNGHINSAILHLEGRDSVNVGVRMNRAAILTLIRTKGNTVFTMRWSYDGSHWLLGSAQVGVYPRNGVDYIRTHPDATEKDNLDNMIPMHHMGL